MQKFEYRTPRYDVDLPVLYLLEGAGIAGRCKEISKEGMRVEFRQPIALDSCGIIRISYKALSLELRAAVAHAGSGYVALKFIFESEKDRGALEHLVVLLAGPTGQLGPVLVQ
jgi:hypothetical protein